MCSQVQSALDELATPVIAFSNCKFLSNGMFALIKLIPLRKLFYPYELSED